MSAHHDCGSPGSCPARRGAMLWGGRGLGALALAAQILLVLSAQAQSLNDLSGALGGGKGGTEALGGLPSLDQASPSNIAGRAAILRQEQLPGRRRQGDGQLAGRQAHRGLAKAPRTAASRRE